MFCPEDENALLLFNINKARYTVMSEVFGGLNKINHMNIVVDSNKIFEGFRQSYTKASAQTLYDEKLDHNLAAEFFNWIAHYRRYFKTLGIEISFFIIHGNDNPFAEDLVPEWNSDYKIKEAKFINFVIEKRIRAVAQFIPEVFIINSSNTSTPFDRANIPLILKKEGYLGNSNTLYLTNDINVMQIITLLPKSYILRVSSKTANFISKGKVFEYLSKDYKESISGIPDNFLGAYYALMGGNGTPPISKKLKKAMVLKGLKTLGASYTELDAEILFTLFSEKIDTPYEETILLLSNRLKAFNHMSKFISNVSIGITDEIESQMVNQPDHERASTLNNGLFGGKIDINTLF